MKRIVVINNKGGCGKSTLVLSLADTLTNAQVVDLDNQATLTRSASFTGRHAPVQAGNANGEYVIFDTPPYRDSTLRGVLASATHVLIPVLLGYPDLLATRAIVDDLVKQKLLAKATIVFSKVRKPHNKAYHELKRLFAQNYQDVTLATSEISELTAYQKVLAAPLQGKAKEEMKCLATELMLY